MAIRRKRYVPPARRAPAMAAPVSEAGGSGESTACPKCGAEAEAGEAFCARCGTALSRAADAWQRGREARRRKVLIRSIKRGAGAGRGYILALAIIQFLGSLFLYAILPQEYVIVPLIGFAQALIYLGLWIWAKTSPLPALVAALAIFIGGILAGVAVDPATLFQGIVIKIIILLGLAGGIRSALVARRMEETVQRGGRIRRVRSRR